MKLFFQFSFLCFVAFFAMQCSPKINKTVQKEKSVSTAPPAVPPTPTISTGATLSDAPSNIPTEPLEMESSPITNEQLAVQKEIQFGLAHVSNVMSCFHLNKELLDNGIKLCL